MRKTGLIFAALAMFLIVQMPSAAQGLEVRSEVIDWSGRVLGKPSNPNWLLPLVRGKKDTVKSAFNIPDDYRVNCAVSQGSSLEDARIQAEKELNRKPVNEICAYILSVLGRRLNDTELMAVTGKLDQTIQFQGEFVEPKTALTGVERVTDFWQLVETINPAAGTTERQYTYWIVYAMSPAAFKQNASKYVLEAIGVLPDKAMQNRIAKAYMEGIEE